MHPDIQKAVDAGKLSAAAGQTLDQLQPGTYVVHKSWGLGRWTPSIPGEPDDDQLQAEEGAHHAAPVRCRVAPAIKEDHILAQKASDLSAVKSQAKEDPVGLTRKILNSYGGRATQDQIMQALLPDVFSEGEFKKWWENTKKALKKDGHFAIPAKKTDMLEMREDTVSHADQYLAAFASARQLKAQLAALDQIIKNIGEFSNPAAQLAPIVAAAEDAARKNQRLNPSQALEFLVSRDEIVEKAPGLSGARMPQHCAVPRGGEAPAHHAPR